MTLLAHLNLLSALLCGDISGQNTMTFGVGTEILDAARPISKANLYINLEVGHALSKRFSLLTSFDLGLPQAGQDSDGSSKLLFIGKLYESLRVTIFKISDSFAWNLEGGGGGYLSRHKQDRLPAAGLRSGFVAYGGTGINYFPFIQQKYMWSDMFIQLKGQFWHYFKSEYLFHGYTVMVGFGGTFF